jgi:hypothetical protein
MKYEDSVLNALSLHDLLVVGLWNLRKHERAPGCVVDMQTWLCTDGRGCVACLGGSVMAHGMRMFKPDRKPKWLYALDALRQGRVNRALLELDRQIVDGADVLVFDYHANQRGWWRRMNCLRRRLAKEGL